MLIVGHDRFLTYYGPEFIAKRLRKWLAGRGTRPLYIEPGSPWENGHCESFSKLRDELLNGEIFYSLKEAVLTEKWRVHYNTIRPHSSLGYRPPAPATLSPPALNICFASWLLLTVHPDSPFLVSCLANIWSEREGLSRAKRRVS